MNRKQLKRLKRSKLKKKQHNISKMTNNIIRPKVSKEYDGSDMSWKRTVKKKGLFGTKEVPFFDPNFCMKYLRSHCGNGKLMPFTDEMMQWLLKSVADIDPTKLQQGGNPKDDYSVVSLSVIIMQVFECTELHGVGLENSKLFLKHQHLINNKKMLFLFLSKIYLRNPQLIDIELLEKTAMNFPLKERLFLTTFKNFSSITKTPDEFIEELNGEYTYVYRTFRVRKGESIRKGVNKVDNIHWTTHEEGRGVSYSLTKCRAVNIAYWMHKSMLEKYSSRPLNELMNSNIYESITPTFKEPAQFQDDVYCALGLFRIEKEDVIGA